MGIHDAPTVTCRDCGAEIEAGVWFDAGRRRRTLGPSAASPVAMSINDHGSQIYERTVPGACKACGGGRLVLDGRRD